LKFGRTQPLNGEEAMTIIALVLALDLRRIGGVCERQRTESGERAKDYDN